MQNRSYLALIAAAAITASISGMGIISNVQAEDLLWSSSMSMIGEAKYKDGFDHYDFVNPQAPKGGALHLSTTGTFNTLNPFAAKGDLATGFDMIADSMVLEPLFVRSEDDISANYGLLAEAVAFPKNLAFAKFRLNAKATFSDGSPVTPDDVVFSFNKVKEHNPQMFTYYKHVTKAEKTGDREITFTFDETGNRELPSIVSELRIASKSWWEAKGPDGKPRDIARQTLEPVLGSGPYKVALAVEGTKIRFERNPDYWGKDLPVNVGRNNFDVIEYTYFGDNDVEFESFRSGSTDFWSENAAKRWATAYDFPAVSDGRVKRETPDNAYRSSGVMVGFIPNERREMFKDPKVRQALSFAFDFEELNRTIFYNNYKRINSFFYGSELASSGLPTGRELEILNGYKGQIPEAAIDSEFTLPVGGTPENLRKNLQMAIKLLKEAGYELKGSRMINSTTGKPLQFEIMLNGPTIERVALPFAQNLKKIGIEATVRTVDEAQYTNRVRSYDYDMIYLGWAQSINPGNEQADYWGSKSAAVEGGRNYAGVANPVLDDLTQKITFAKDRDEQVAMVKVLDRVLLHSYIIIPSYTLRNSRLAYWDRLARPAEYPQYGLDFPAAWWSQAAGK
jgi:microcin C transport system substrate-binding protein